MNVPNNPILKGIKRPDKAVSWLSNRVRAIYDRQVYTPLRSRFLFDYTDDWDLAVILDACRYDLAKEASQTYPWLDSPERVTSPAGHSSGWLSRTFDRAEDDKLAETVYITGNQHSESAIDTSKIKACDEVWRYAWDSTLECVPPRPITDRAIRSMRESKGGRYIVHYMQPHLPPITENERYEVIRGFDPTDDWVMSNPWVLAEQGRIQGDLVKAAYKDNINPVLDEVKLLIDNVPVSKVVITADHGNYLGEKGLWGHRHPHHTSEAVRAVPWWEVTAEDMETHHPAQYEKKDLSTSREEQLQALGYR